MGLHEYIRTNMEPIFRIQYVCGRLCARAMYIVHISIEVN